MKKLWSASMFVVVVLLLAACQPAAAPTRPATQIPTMPVATATPAAAEPVAIPETGQNTVDEVVVTTASDPKLGDILVDGKGMTLYMFKKDAPNTSNCTGDCLKAWPPLISNGSPEAGAGVDKSLLGTAKLDDGRLIVTYAQMPLYYWAADQKPGDTTGQNVNGVWFVVAPDGKIVETGASGMPKDSTNSAAAAAPTQVTQEDDYYSRGEKTSNDIKLAAAKDPILGPILVDGKGMTLYIFTKDTADTSNCAGDCLKAWPPLIAAGKVKAEDGVNQALIGTAVMADGRTIVTYNHRPLYYWAADGKPGDTTGQGVNQVWFVISPEGEPVGQ